MLCNNFWADGQERLPDALTESDTKTIYAIGVSERKKEYRGLGKYREVWGSWRDE